MAKTEEGLQKMMLDRLVWLQDENTERTSTQRREYKTNEEDAEPFRELENVFQFRYLRRLINRVVLCTKEIRTEDCCHGEGVALTITILCENTLDNRHETVNFVIQSGPRGTEKLTGQFYRWKKFI